MPTIKTYLQSLINALQKKSVENVSPNSELHSKVMVNSGETLVSPVDGFVSLVSQSATGDHNFLVAVSNASSHQHSTPQNLICRLDLPVKKGASIQVKHQNIGLVTASFITRVGGGIRRLLSQAVRCVRGGGLCLKTSLKHSLKQCLRIRRASLRLSACRTVVLFIKHIHHRKALLLSRLMGRYGFNRNATVYKSILIRVLLSSITKISNGHPSYCPSRKDRTLCITSLTDSLTKLTFGLFTIKQTNNIATESLTARLAPNIQSSL